MTRNGTENDDVSLICESGFRKPKVALFLDVPNIYMGCKGNGNKYRPKTIFGMAKRQGNVTHAFAYTRLSFSNGVPGWISTYRRLGFELRFIFDSNNGSEPKDVDTSLVTDALETAYTTDVDIFVIASGDSDYVPLVRALRKAGKKTVIIAHKESLSHFLKGIADEVVLLESGQRKEVETSRTSRPSLAEASVTETRRDEGVLTLGSCISENEDMLSFLLGKKVGSRHRLESRTAGVP